MSTSIRNPVGEDDCVEIPTDENFLVDIVETLSTGNSVEM